MTSSLMGLVGFELIGIAISRRIYRCAACVQRERSRRLDHMAVSRKFGELAVNALWVRLNSACCIPEKIPLIERWLRDPLS
jgi:hypothetical protein